jgi:hypothetical protein
MKASNLLNPLYVYERRDRIVPYLRQHISQLPQQIHQAVNALDIPVTANDRRLAALKDLHRGQRAFIIGTGPSLRVSDLDRLKGEVTFACNKIYLAFDETDWRPTYYSVYDVLVAKNYCDTISKLELHKIFGSCVRPFFLDTSGITYVNELPLSLRNGEPQIEFSKNVLLGAYGGWTVIYMQMQLAFYMGIREIYLIGVDFSFTIPESTGEMTERGEVILKHAGEVNHFHPDYRKPGEKWTLPRLDYQYKAFLCAKEAFELEGGFIANASHMTALDVFPLVDFDRIVPP